MTTDSSQDIAVSPSCLLLEVHAPDGSVHTHELERGNVLVVGSSSACGLRLDSPQIAGMHCTIEFTESGITIRDWDTKSGTYLNGHRIEEEQIDEGEFEIRIAGFRVQSRLAGDSVTQQHSEDSRFTVEENRPSPTADDHPIIDQASPDYDTPGWLIAELEGEGGQFARPREEMHTAGDDASRADSERTDSPRFDHDRDPWDTPKDTERVIKDTGYAPVPDAYQRDVFQDDAAELLQVEIDILRAELAERDERLRELEEFAAREADSPPSGEDAVTPVEVESLVGRLEDLLAELEQSDARIATLNETLRTSEEAVQTADEERQQLEGWLGEVDRRVGQWEQEWQAERECLNKTIAELTEQRDRAEQRLAAGVTDDSSGRAADHLIQELREQYAHLHSSYQALEQENNRLLVRVEVGEIADVEGQVKTAVDEALREERLQLAQEKASLAREKSELVKRQAELQDHLQRKAQTSDSADHRIRAFREHLREIHENEPHLIQGPTLSQRLGKLWRKLDGHPLDTD